MVFMHCKFRAVTSHWWFHVNQIQLQLNWQKLTDQSSTHNVIQYFFFNHSVVSEWKLEIGHRNNTACSKLNLVQSSRSKSTSWQQPAWEKGVSGCSVLNQAAQFFHWDASSSLCGVWIRFRSIANSKIKDSSESISTLFHHTGTKGPRAFWKMKKCSPKMLLIWLFSDNLAMMSVSRAESAAAVLELTTDRLALT